MKDCSTACHCGRIIEGAGRYFREITLKKIDFRIDTLALVVLMAGCQGQEASSAGAVTGSPSTAKSALFQTWIGKWDGPEGTYLILSRASSAKNDKYLIEIRDLDGSKTFEGVPSGDRILFTRNGNAESIHAGDGEEAGMKWLLDKKQCLVIKHGEGFCRD
jgi:hypothetical protein